jgi:hypothetical protein
MSNGLSVPDAHIVLPISPRRLCIATNNDDTFQAIAENTADELTYKMNNQVTQQAYKFVYGTDASQLRFVANRLGERVPSSPFG